MLLWPTNAFADNKPILDWLHA